MGFFKKVFGWLGHLFHRASDIIKENALLVKASIGAGLGLFLENNEEYADEVVEALKGLDEALEDGRISTNSVLLAELRSLFAKYGLKPGTSAAVMALFEAAVQTMEQYLSGSSDEFTNTWRGIVQYALSIAEGYLQDA